MVVENAGFVKKHAINYGIGIKNAKMNGWKKTDESLDKVLAVV
jgi:hypothetical protein